jgi:hypothetical protein
VREQWYKVAKRDVAHFQLEGPVGRCCSRLVMVPTWDSCASGDRFPSRNVGTGGHLRRQLNSETGHAAH